MRPLIGQPRNPAIRGRDSELASVGEQLARLRSGVGAVILVEGGAGIGKTRLLDEAAAMASRMSSRSGVEWPTQATA
jgi:predicted ATPase